MSGEGAEAPGEGVDTALPEAVDRAASIALPKVASVPNADLLRGTPVHNVMCRFGAMLGNSAGTEKTYALSRRVEFLDDFISHNWSTNKQLKFFALALHYNTGTALLAAFFVAVACSLLTSIGALPVINIGVSPWSINSFLAGQLTFLSVFLCKYDIDRLLGFLARKLGCRKRRRHRIIFLDKICIHQTDAEVQKEGIKSLAGFLRKSDKMVVVYSSLYLKKLWTIYEIASFLTLHSHSRIELVPIIWTKIFTVLFVGDLVFNNISVIFYGVLLHRTGTQESEVWSVVMGVAVMLAVPMYAAAIRRWQRRFSHIQEEMRSFSIRSAMCAVEEDRTLVEGNVCTFMRYLRRVPPSASDEEALNEFERMVQEQLPNSLLSTFGRNTFPYRVIVAASMSNLLLGCDDVAVNIVGGYSFTNLVTEGLISASASLLVIPLCVAILSRVMRTKLHLTGKAEFLYVAFLVIFLAFPLAAALWLPLFLLRLLALAEHEALACWGMVGYCLLLALFTAWMHREELLSSGSQEPSIVARDVCSVGGAVSSKSLRMLLSRTALSRPRLPVRGTAQ